MWGLGKGGLRRYEDLIPFLKDKERDVILHAIAAFGSDASQIVIDLLVAEMLSGESPRAAAASEALRIIGSELVLSRLIAAAKAQQPLNDWLLATLGRLTAANVRRALAGDPLLERLGPLLLLAPSENWIANDMVDIDLKFVLKQNL